MQKRNTPIQALSAALLIIFAVCLFFGGQAKAQSEQLLVGEMKAFRLQNPPRPVSDVEFLDGSGQPIKLSAFRGKVVLLTLWATWCPYCMKEMPSLSDLQASLGSDKFMVLPVNVDKRSANDVKSFLEERSLNLPTYMDPKTAISLATGTHGLPYSILIDKDGNEIGRMGGETNWSAPEALNLIRNYIN